MFIKPIGWLPSVIAFFLTIVPPSDQIAHGGEVAKNSPLAPKKLWTSANDHGFMRALAISDDGRYLAVAFSDTKIVVWSLATCMEHNTLDGAGIATWVGFQPKSNVLASLHNYIGTRDVKLWDVAKGVQLRIVNAYPAPTSVAWQPDGKLLAISGLGRAPNNKPLGFWNPTTGENVKMWVSRGTVRPMLFTPDGKLLFGFTGASGRILRCWEVASDKELQPLLTTEDDFAKICVSPCSKWLVVAEAKKSIRLFETNGKEIRSFSLPADYMHDIAYSPSGKFVVGAFQAAEPYLVFWDPASGKEIHRYKGLHIVRLAISPDSRLLAGGGKDGVHVIQLQANGN